jgi:hypothetical protein
MRRKTTVVLTRRFNLRWRPAAVAAGYVLALAMVANLAFGASGFFARGASTAPARTGGYAGRLPVVTPLDGQRIALAITEASGGPPTIGVPLPVDQPPSTTTTTASAPKPAGTITVTSTPTYTAVTKTSTTPYWYSLLSLIPTNLKFPPRASPHRR